MGDMNVGKPHECIDLNNDTVADCEHRDVPAVRGLDDDQVGRTRPERLAQGTARL
jgi:hypothetical protein